MGHIAQGVFFVPRHSICLWFKVPQWQRGKNTRDNQKNNILPINFKSLTVRWWSLYFNDLNCKISWKRDSERFILLGFPKVNVFVHLVCQVKFKLDQYVQTIYWLFYNSSLSECLLCFSSITCFFFVCLELMSILKQVPKSLELIWTQLECYLRSWWTLSTPWF